MGDNTDADDATGEAADPVVLPGSSTDEDVEFATAYHATVNNVVEYGVFVTLADGYSGDVSGLVHTSNLPALHGSDDFAEGDTFAVQLRERSADGLSFEVIEVLEGAKDTSGTQGAPLRDYSPAEDEDGTAVEGPASIAASQSRLDAITARLDAIETHLALDAPTVRARVIDAGEDATLLRVLDSRGEMDVDHGEVVTVSVHDTSGRETGKETDEYEHSFGTRRTGVNSTSALVSGVNSQRGRGCGGG